MDKEFDVKLRKSYREFAERFNDNLSENDKQKIKKSIIVKNGGDLSVAEKRHLSFLILDAYNHFDELEGQYTANQYSKYVFESISKEYNVPLIELNIIFGKSLELL